MNKTKTDCETTLCYYETATRPQFFHGMLLTDEHLRNEQNYHREALKRVNRHLWGSGIVCGLKIEKQGLCIKINPGVALDCCGNLIEVCKCITLDLSKECDKEHGADCPPRPPQGNNEPYKIKKYLVLRYQERPIDLQPVLTPDTDCEPAGGKSNCSASKVQEGFCVELWDHCPCPHKDQGEQSLTAILTEAGKQTGIASRAAATGAATTASGSAGIVTGQGEAGGINPAQSTECIDLPLDCEDCGCCESAVALAVLDINCTDKSIARNIECDCRRYVMSPRLLNWLFTRVRPKTLPAEAQAIYSRLGSRADRNAMASGMTFETMKAPDTRSTVDPATGTKPPVDTTAAVDSAAASAAAATKAKAAASDAKLESMNNKIKKLNDEIASLKKLTSKLTKEVTPAVTPPAEPSTTPSTKT